MGCDYSSPPAATELPQSANKGSKSTQIVTSTDESSRQVRSTGNNGINASPTGDQSPLALSPLGVPRIIAPNVGKLNVTSIVEVRLQSITETTPILCSVDVLKMRSAYLHGLLNVKPSEAPTTGSPGSPAPNANGRRKRTLTVQTASSSEALALLSSLHGGKHLYRPEWNLHWVRLRYHAIISDRNTRALRSSS
jgi:hypothetical protein